MMVEFYKRSPSIFGRVNGGKVAEERIEELVKAGWRMLHVNKEVFSQLWDWTPVFNLLTQQHTTTQQHTHTSQHTYTPQQHTKRGISYYAIQCIAIIMSLSPAAVLSLNQQFLSISAPLAERYLLIASFTPSLTSLCTPYSL